MRAAVYVRVSTDEQVKNGYSVEAQQALLERKATEWGDTIVKMYVDDGYSAGSMKRPGMQQLLADAEKRLFDVAIFWRLDRLTRNSRNFHAFHERLQKSDVGIKSATEKIDTTTAIGRFQLELSVSLAQLERETISERVQFVMEERARKGLRNGSSAPYGYEIVEGSFVINEEKAEIIHRIFDVYLNGTGMKSIAHILNREGKPSPSNGSLWSAPGIKYILQNPVYIGKLRWNYVDKNDKKTDNAIISDDHHDPIVELQTFERVQVEITRRKSGGKKFTNDFIFSSVLRCAQCGGTLHGNGYSKPSGWYRRYRCSNKLDYGTCKFHTISETAVTRAFLESLNMNMVDLYRVATPDGEAEERERIKTFQNEMEAIAKRKKRWQLAYAGEAISLEELRQHTEDDRKREEEIKKTLDSIPQNTKTYLSKDEIDEALLMLKDTWYDIPDDRSKKLFIQEAFEYIKIDTHPDSKLGQGSRIRVRVTDFKLRF